MNLTELIVSQLMNGSPSAERPERGRQKRVDIIHVVASSFAASLHLALHVLSLIQVLI